MGSIGKDEFGATLEKKARAGGVNVCYQKQDEHPTGKVLFHVLKKEDLD